MRYDSVIFDLDGTLWDAADTSAQGWNSVLDGKGLGVRVEGGDIRQVSGMPFRECVQVVFGESPLSSDSEFHLALDDGERRAIEDLGGRLFRSARTRGIRSMQLIHISRTGVPAVDIPNLPEAAMEVGAAYVGLYEQMGFVPPWLGYFALDGSDCIGTCGFKSPPVANRAEIAYFTFPEFESRGYATRMAEALIELGRIADMKVLIAAQTLPHESASTTILRRLGFALVGTVDHPEDGPVWEWQLSNGTPSATREDARDSAQDGEPQSD